MRTIQRIKFAITPIAISSLMLICSSHSFAKQYYKWVDSKGSTHYTTTPPPKNAKKQTKVETYGYRHTIAPQTPNMPTTSTTSSTTNTTVPNPQVDSQPTQNNETLQKGQPLNNNAIQAQ